MTTTTRPARLNYTNAWSHLGDLTWDQLALVGERIEAGLETGRSDALWLGRYDRWSAELERRGVIAYRADEHRRSTLMVGYPSMFEAIA